MTESQIKKHLKTSELNIQNAYAALWLVDLAFTSYVNSQIVHKTSFSPVFCYISYKHLKSFYQIIPQKNIRKGAKKVYCDYLKNPKTLTAKIEKHKKIAQELNKTWEKYQTKKESFENFFEIDQKLISICQEWWQYAFLG